MYKTNVKSYNFLEKPIINCYNIKGGIKTWKKIENELKYPGTIKVTVIRETRCTEEAK